MLSLLKTKFGEKSNPLYIIKDILSEDLDEERKIERFKKHETIKGFSKFQITVFEPHKKMRVSTRLCICEDCQQHYGPYKMFNEYDLNVQLLKTTRLRSGLLSFENLGIENDKRLMMMAWSK